MVEKITVVRLTAADLDILLEAYNFYVYISYSYIGIQSLSGCLGGVSEGVLIPVSSALRSEKHPTARYQGTSSGCATSTEMHLTPATRRLLLRCIARTNEAMQ